MTYKFRILLSLIFCSLVISACALQDGLSDDSSTSTRRDAGGGGDRDTDAPLGNLCGGDLTLRYDGADALPGDACGACGGGTLECDGANALHCAGQTGVSQPGSACAGGGTWVCAPNNDVVCKVGLVAPQNVKASTDNPAHVTVSWTPVNGAVGYQVEVGPNVWLDVGNVSQWDDTSALPGVITAGSISTTLGTNFDHVELAATEATSQPGASRRYHVQAVDATGQIGPRSRGVDGARSVGPLSYHWQRTSTDSSIGTYADLALGCASQLACTDVSAPQDGSVRYYRLRISAAGAQTVESEPARGAIGRLHLAFATPPPAVVSAGELFEVEVGLENQFADPMSIAGIGVTLTLNSRSFASGSERMSQTTDLSGTAVFEASITTAAANYVLTAAESLADSAIVEASSAPFRVAAAEAIPAGATIGGTTQIPADGQTPSIITITLRDSYGNNVAGVTPAFKANGSEQGVGGCTETDSRGQAKCTLRSASAGIKALAISAPISKAGGTVEFVEANAQWQSLSLGSEHSCGIDIGGKLWCWGSNGNRQLGNDSVESQAWPVEVSGGHTWSQVSLALKSACAIRSDKSLWCWGLNNYGHLGLGDTATRSSPAQVGSDLNWSQVSVGARHTCAIRDDSTLWCWGENGWGQLGNGSTASSDVPAQIGSVNSWAQVSSGTLSTCAVRDDGSLWCWGANNSGQLGDGTTDLRTEPVRVGEASSVWEKVELSKSGMFGCALQSNQSLWCWGENGTGQLGINPSTHRSTVPVKVGLTETWTDLSLGHAFACATRSDQSLWCWGRNLRGELGDATMVSRYQPAEVASAHTWRTLAVGYEHACALDSTRSIWCWGLNDVGQLGIRRAGTKQLPAEVTSPAVSFVQISGGSRHACGVDSNQRLWCWGGNLNGELGIGSALDQPSVVQVGTALDWRAVSAGTQHTCAIRESGTLWCWGTSADGALGLGSTQSTLTPMQVGSASDWLSVSASNKHTCAIRADHTLWCWGDAALFDPDTTASNTREPVQVGGAQDWETIAAGSTHQCGTRLDGTLWCWGSNDMGQLGQGNQRPATAPARVGSGTQWASVQVRHRGTCGLQDDQTLWCWGVHTLGQAGVGGAEAESILQPRQVGTYADWTSMGIGDNHGCGVRQSKLWCWGYGTANGRSTRQYSPVQVDAAQDWARVYAGKEHMHGVHASGSFWSWGNQSFGQLGDGDAWVTVPVPLTW